MADKGKDKKAAKGKDAKPAKAKKKGLSLPMMLIFGGAALGFLPLTCIVIAGMLPTLVTLVTDRTRGRSQTVSIAVTNAAAVLYVALQFVKMGFGFEHALFVLTQSMNYAIMWGGAAIGFALHSIVPPAVAQVVAGFSDSKIAKLRYNQRELKRIWGENVDE